MTSAPLEWIRVGSVHQAKVIAWLHEIDYEEASEHWPVSVKRVVANVLRQKGRRHWNAWVSGMNPFRSPVCAICGEEVLRPDRVFIGLPFGPPAIVICDRHRQHAASRGRRADSTD